MILREDSRIRSLSQPHGALRALALSLLALSLFACNAEESERVATTTQAQITENPPQTAATRFYWLPPIVPAIPAPPGRFDVSQFPTLTIEEVGAGGRIRTLLTYSRSAAEPNRLRLEQEAYVATWLTTSLDPRKPYRIRAFSGTIELGLADVDVVETAAEAANVNRRVYVPVIKGGPFEIRFGINTVVNEAPVANAQTLSTDEDSTLAIRLTGTDAENAALTYTLLGQPNHGTLIGTAPNLSYAPHANYNGADQFSFRVSDGTLSSTAAIVQIAVTPVNDVPTADAQTVTTPENTPLALELTGADIEDAELAFQVVEPPLHGTLSGDGAFVVYTPAANYAGTDSFSFISSDSESAESGVATVSITVTPVNEAPTANAQVLEVGAGLPLPITLTGSDPDGDALTFAVVRPPSHGSLSGSAGQLVYTSAPDYGGVDEFEFVARDGELTSAPAKVTISVNRIVNEVPVANSQTLSIQEDSTLSIQLTGNDPENSTLTYVLLGQPSHGILSGTAPNLTYTPDPNFNGEDQFSFRVSDGTESSAPATVLLDVTPVNDVPTADPQSVTTAEDTPLEVELTGADVEDAELAFQVLNPPLHGTLSSVGGAFFLYTPAANYAGTDSFGFVSSDSEFAESNLTTVSITVTPVNEAPAAHAQTLEVVSGVALPIVLTGSDPDGDALTFEIVRQPSHGSLVFGSGEQRVYTSVANYSGTDEFEFIARDGDLTSAPAKVTISVARPPNHPPVAVDDAYEVNIAGAFSVAAPGILGNDTDPDGDALSTSLVTGPSNGTLALAPNGSFTYTPSAPSPGSGALAARVEWAWTTGTAQVSDTRVVLTPTVADLDGDGAPEVLFTSMANQLFVLSGQDGHELFRISNVYGVSTSVAVGDLEGDGRPDIVAVGVSSRLLAFEGDGTPKWNLALPFNIGEGNVALADLDGDGKAEIITGEGAENSGITVINANGTIRWRSANKGCGNNEYRSNCIPVVADIDLDGSPEIIGGHTVYAGNGSVKWSADSIGDGFTAVGNFDSDAFAEIVLVRLGRVYVLEHDGRVKWGPMSIPGGGGAGGPPVVADFDRDGAPEIGVAGISRYAVFETNGTLKWQAPIVDASHRTGSTVFDFQNDGAADVVFRDEQKLFVFRGVDGAVLLSTPVGSSTTVEYPVIADVDDDGQAEIVVSSDVSVSIPGGTTRGPGLYVFGSASGNWAPTRKIWNQFDYHVTNVLDDGAIPALEQPNWLVPQLNTHRVNSIPPAAERELVDSFTYLTHDGALDSNTATVNLRAKPPNRAPQITGMPPATASVDVRYTYAVQVSDPDPGDVFTYALTENPAGMTISSLGVVDWTPSQSQIGDHRVTVRVQDRAGFSAFQAYTLKVTLPNHAPQITSSPVLSATRGVEYVYAVEATDPDGDTLEYRLDDGPLTMSIDAASGVLQFTPEALHVGNQPVVVSVDDLRGGTASQSFTLVVSEPHPPLAQDDAYEVRLYETLNVPAPGILGNDSDPDGDLLTASLVTGPTRGTLALQPNGSFTYTPKTLEEQATAAFTARVEWYRAGEGGPLSVADLFGDGTPEIIFPRSVFNGRTGTPLFTLAGSDWTVQPAVGDLEGDGNMDIVVVNGTPGTGQTLFAHARGGTTKWSATPFPGTRIVQLALADLDGNGTAEIVVTRGGDRGVAALNSNGTVRWQAVLKGAGCNTNSATCVLSIADIDLDGSPDIIGGHTVYASNGSVKWSADSIGDGFTGVGNFDSDAFAEIVLVRAGQLYLLEHDGQKKWGPVAIPSGGRGGPPLIADLDHDGAPEIGVAALRSYAVFEGDGTLKWQAETVDLSSSITGATAFDFENDGAMEVVYRDEFNLFVFRGTDGAVRWSTPMGSGTTAEYPVVADVDGDGEAEIVTFSDVVRVGGASTGLYVFGSANGKKWAPTRTLWNQYDYHVTNILDDGKIPAHEQPNWLAPGLNTHRVNTITPPAPALEQVDSFTYLTHDGALDSNTATVSVRVKPANRAPQITGTPPAIANADARYTYAVQVSDPDPGDVFTYALTERPAGMTISPLGVVDWTPTQSQVADHRVGIRVQDRAGFSAFQVYTLTVKPPNRAPQITSSAISTAQVGIAYVYAVEASDPDGDTLTYTLADAPLGMSIGALTGVIQWTPPTGTPNERVEVVVSDGRGAQATQTFTIAFANHPPTITSTPIESIRLGNTYTYAVQASDPDGEVLSFRLTSAPPGMTIGPSTGLVQWTPATAHLGSHAVNVEASDGRGGSASQSFTLTVRSPAQNQGPDITSTPAFQAKVGRAYSYLPTAVDPDGDALTWSLGAAPPGMTVNPTTGAVSWVPTNVGSYVPRLRVSDGLAGTEQAWSIDVVGANVVLTSELLISPSTVSPGESITVGVAVGGEAGPVTVTATLDGTPFTLAPNQSLVLTAPNTTGQHCIVVDVSDGYETKHVESCFRVIDPSDNRAPVVHIDGPRAGASAELLVVTAPEAVIASAADENLTHWTLTLREQGASEDEAIEVASGDGNIDTVEVGKLDPTLLLNGLYTLVLTAEDAAGNVAEDSVLVSIEGAMKLGHFSISFEDLKVPVAGLPVTVTRTYDTRERHRNLDFGYGWSVDVTSVRLQESRRPGFAWTLTAYPSGPLGTIPNWCIESALGNVVSVTLPDGDVEKFRAVTYPACNQGEPYVHVELRFEPLEGTNGKLEALNDSVGLFLNNQLTSLDDPSRPLDPNDYRYTNAEGQEFTIDQSFGLRKIEEHEFGSTVTFNRDGVVHSSGFSISFERDARGRIVSAIAPDNSEIRYEYGPDGDFSAVTNANGNRTQFTYVQNPDIPPHYLEDIIDPRGVRVARNEYDDNGRLIALVDPDGNRIEYNHDPDGRAQRIKNARGFTTTYLYNDRGDVLVETNPLGKSIHRTYDADGNTLSETDALGRTRRWTYDSRGNVLTETDAAGGVTRNAYGAFNQLTTITDANNVVIQRNEYDNFLAGGEPVYPGPLLRRTNGNNKITRYIYSQSTGLLGGIIEANGASRQFISDSHGFRVANVDELGQRTDYVNDAMGRVLEERQIRTNAQGQAETHVTRYTRDARGNILETEHPDGSITTMTYDANDQPVEQCDALARCTTKQHDTRGYVLLVTYPDGNSERTTRDANGNVISQTDRLGRTTRFAFDAADQLIETIHPDSTPSDEDNPRTRKVYDDAGQVIQQIDENGNATAYEYDLAGRETKTILPEVDGERAEAVTEYDLVGRRTRVLDPKGQATRFEYDGIGRLLRTIGAPVLDEHSAINSAEFDAVGRRIAETDASGLTVRFAYDARSQLIRVILPNPVTGANPPLVNGVSPDSGTLTTVYAYDELGNKIQQVDAEGRITRWEYDAIGREVARVLPDGQREEKSYNAAGELVALRDFNGKITSYEYDAAGRRTLVEYENGVVHSFGYNAAGARINARDEHGESTYAFDARGRLTRATNGAGAAIDYEYDAVGNLLRRRSPHQTLTYAYDARNRLASATRSSESEAPLTTLFEYDVSGNRSALIGPDGTRTDYVYDARDRLRQLSKRRADNELLVSATYELDSAGRRTRVEESDAAGLTRTVQYAYDGVKRLKREAIDHVDDIYDRASAWTHDRVGNRLTQSVSAGAAPADLTTYSYDANDRLGTEAHGEDTFTYTYDGNGNTVGQAGPGVLVTNRYDDANRLVEVQTAAGTTQYSYDANGLRTQRVNTSAEGASVTTLYLQDVSFEFAQVLEELSASGAEAPVVSATYSVADELLEQTRYAQDGTATSSIVHQDGFGSVRWLTSIDGTLTDSIDYDAFGNTVGRIGTTAIDRRYRGESFDPSTGLYYLRARWMDPSTGRFTQQDTHPGFGRDPLSLHKYLYAHGDPTNATDPSGQLTLMEMAQTIAISYSPVVFGLGATWLRAMPYAQRVAQQASYASSYLQSYSPQVQGVTTQFGQIFMRMGLAGNQLMKFVKHEAVHQFFTPGKGAILAENATRLQRLRVSLATWGYSRSQLLMYLEEGFFAQGVATKSPLQGLAYPLQAGYKLANGTPLSAGKIALEGGLYLGTIGGGSLLGREFSAWLLDLE